MIDTTSWRIGPTPGYAPQIGHLVAMMRWTREMTLATVEGLTVEQLDYLHDEKSNSIGALLMHIAAVESEYAAQTFEERELTETEMERWGAALELGARGRQEIRGYPLEHYLATLEEVRGATLRRLAEREDEWLYREFPFWDDLPANCYFVWFHVVDDELSHRGQMRWLYTRLPGV